MRLIFSSITLLRSCGALDMTVMYINIRTASGTMKARAAPTASASLT